ncbi:MAG: nucleoside hydrolase [Armatimonadota bacterium]
MAEKLILDTDIGSDVDDAWALALCLASPEINLLGITLVHADLDVRAKIALKMLKLTNRQDTPVYKGISQPLTPDQPCHWAGFEGTNTDFSDIDESAAKDGAVDFILDTVKNYPGEVVITPIGPLTNIATAIQRDPETMREVKRLAIMGSTYTGDGHDHAEPEHNIRCDSAAAKIVLESGIPVTLVGLNVTSKVVIRREELSAIKSNPFGDYLAAMTEQIFELWHREATNMHDPLAVATQIDPSLCKTRKMRADVLAEGKVAWVSDDNGWIDVCVDVDAARFEKLLMSRVTELATI